MNVSTSNNTVDSSLSAFSLLLSFLIFWALPTHAETIRLTTEHYPPYNIDLTLSDDCVKKGGDTIGGASTEIVTELMNRAGYQYSIELMPWKRAYRAAETETFTGVFSTTRTKARENLFKWVGPIADNNYVLFSAGDKDIQINKISDLRKFRIGAYSGGAGEALLKEARLPFDVVSSDHLNTLKLARNRIDLWISGNLYGPYLAKQNGVSNLKPVYTVREAQMYIAFNPNTPDSIIRKLNSTLEAMDKEGFLERIYARYR